MLPSSSSTTSIRYRHRRTTTGRVIALFVVLALIGLAAVLYAVLAPVKVPQQDIDAALEPLPPVFDFEGYGDLIRPLREIGVRPESQNSGRPNPFQ